MADSQFVHMSLFFLHPICDIFLHFRCNFKNFVMARTKQVVPISINKGLQRATLPLKQHIDSYALPCDREQGLPLVVLRKENSPSREQTLTLSDQLCRITSTAKQASATIVEQLASASAVGQISPSSAVGHTFRASANLSVVEQTSHESAVEQTSHVPTVEQTSHVSAVEQTPHVSAVEQTSHVSDVEQTSQVSAVEQTPHVPAVVVQTSHVSAAEKTSYISAVEQISEGAGDSGSSAKRPRTRGPNKHKVSAEVLQERHERKLERDRIGAKG